MYTKTPKKLKGNLKKLKTKNLKPFFLNNLYAFDAKSDRGMGTNVQSRLVYLYLSKALGHGHFWGGVGGVTNWEGRYAGYSSGSVVPPPRSVTGWWSCVSWYSVRVRVVNRILFGEHVVLIYVRASGQLYFSNVYKRYYQPIPRCATGLAVHPLVPGCGKQKTLIYFVDVCR